MSLFQFSDLGGLTLKVSIPCNELLSAFEILRSPCAVANAP